MDSAKSKPISNREHQIRRFYKSAAIIVLNTLLLLMVVELISGGIINIVDRPASKKFIAKITGQPNDMIVYYQGLSYYAEQNWGSTYWKEFKQALKTVYSPYVIWRSVPFHGTLINIDPSGYRHTPGAECGADTYKVYIFGGSAIWGWGSPDDKTIPALLQSGLRSKLGKPVCVMNYGENAYVSTQGVIHLMLLLESGDVPSAVIFYDGVNDVLAASQTGKPILHQNLSEISGLFEDHQAPIIRFFQSTNTNQLLEMALSQLPVSVGKDAPKLEYDPNVLSGQVAEAYLNNYKIVDSLASTYHFDFYFFWQPHILIGNKHLSGEEQNMITGLNWVLNLDPPLIELFQKTYKKIEAETSDHEHLYYLGNIFDPVEDSIWIDTWGHTTPQGNQIVADDLIKVIEK